MKDTFLCTGHVISVSFHLFGLADSLNDEPLGTAVSPELVPYDDLLLCWCHFPWSVNFISTPEVTWVSCVSLPQPPQPLLKRWASASSSPGILSHTHPLQSQSRGHCLSIHTFTFKMNIGEVPVKLPVKIWTNYLSQRRCEEERVMWNWDAYQCFFLRSSELRFVFGSWSKTLSRPCFLNLNLLYQGSTSKSPPFHRFVSHYLQWLLKNT